MCAFQLKIEFETPADDGVFVCHVCQHPITGTAFYAIYPDLNNPAVLTAYATDFNSTMRYTHVDCKEQPPHTVVGANQTNS
mgnify:CR=1 FL=1